MHFANSSVSQDIQSSTGQLGLTDLGLGLQSRRLSGWDRPKTQAHPSQVQTSSPSVPGMLNFSGILGKPPGYLAPESMGMTADFLERFSSTAHITNPVDSSSFLDSLLSSPVDSESSGFSSSSDHLCDLQDSLWGSPPPPYLTANMDPRDTSTPLPRASPAVSIVQEARLHRQAAAVNEAKFIWRGKLPGSDTDPLYSRKVFLGGVPWGVTESVLIDTFSVYGAVYGVEWPGKDGKHPRCRPRDYVYLIFEKEKSVRALLRACFQGRFHTNDSWGYYFMMCSSRMRCKYVQVSPWLISDSKYLRCLPQCLDLSKTVFVGALDGRLKAEALGRIMNDLFGGVMYAGIDTDKHKYPKGSGRVIFNNQQSYLKAVCAAFVKIKTPEFTKKVQIDPYVEDSVCQACLRQPGPFFCRDLECFKYYCCCCWYWQHSILSNHQPLMRN